MDRVTTTAELVAGYGRRFDAQVLTGGHAVASPLGAWLLLALVAPVATGEGRAGLEARLGTTAEDAAARAGALLGDAPPSVSAALAAWHRPNLVTPAYDPWVATWPAGTDRRVLPTQAEADAWTDEHTFGLIPSFPGDLSDPDIAVALVSALATRAAWIEAFEVAPAERLGGPWADQVRQVLRAPRTHTRLLVRTPAAGLVGVHAARTGQGLIVASVVAAPEVAVEQVQEAAYQVLALLTRAPGPAQRMSLFDLPLGDGPAWTISEQDELSTVPEDVTVVLPAWTARSDHDLAGPTVDVGFGLAGAALEPMVRTGPVGLAAGQVAYASFTRTRFEAAAVTRMVVAASARLPQARPRTAEVRFAHPYAVVAAVADPGPHQADPEIPAPPEAWRGVPVFSAWVAEPSEPDDLDPAGS
jgi:hypothetical protein